MLRTHRLVHIGHGGEGGGRRSDEGWIPQHSGFYGVKLQGHSNSLGLEHSGLGLKFLESATLPLVFLLFEEQIPESLKRVCNWAFLRK